MWILETIGVILVWSLGTFAATFMLLELMEPENKERDDDIRRD